MQVSRALSLWLHAAIGASQHSVQVSLHLTDNDITYCVQLLFDAGHNDARTNQKLE